MKIRIAIRQLLRLSLKLALWIVGVLLAISITISLLLLVPSVQQYTVDQATAFLSSKTGMDANVGSIHVRFPKTIRISDIIVKDQQNDTLLYCETLAIRASLLPLIRKNLNVERLRIEGLSSYVYRHREDSTFNFHPIVELFGKSQNKKKENKEIDWDIGFHRLELDNIRWRYEDLRDSTIAKVLLGRFRMEAKSSDLVRQQFDVENVALSGLRFDLMMGNMGERADAEPDKTGEPATYPHLNIRNIELEEIRFNLETISGDFEILCHLGYANLIPTLLSLETQTIELAELLANDIDARIHINSEKQDTVPPQFSKIALTEAAINSSTFGEFPWTINVHHSAVQRAHVRLDLDEHQRKSEGLDYQHMDYQNFSVDASDIYLDKDQASIEVNSLKVNEISGPRIAALSGKFEMNNEGIRAEKINARTSKSSISGQVHISFPGLANIGSRMEDIGIEASLSGHAHLAEIDPISSVRRDFPLLKHIEEIQVDSINTSGKLGDFHLNKAAIHFGDSTHLLMRANVRGLPTSNIDISFHIDTLVTGRDDVLQILPDTLLQAALQLPRSISATAHGTTNLNNVDVEAHLASEMGNIAMLLQKQDDELTASMAVEGIDIGELLTQEMVGKADFIADINAKLTENTLQAIKVNMEIIQMEFNDYTYQDAAIELLWENEQVTIFSTLDDEFLKANLNGFFTHGSGVRYADFDLQVIDASLQELNFMEEYFTIRGKVAVNMELVSQDEFKGLIKINNTDLAYEDRSFHIDEIRFDSDINPNYTNFTLRSEILHAELTGNTKLTEIKDAFVDQLDLFISLPDSVVNPKDFVFEFNLELMQPDILTEFLVSDLRHFELEKCHAKYIDAADLLEVEVIVPALDYKGYEIHNLTLEVDSENEMAVAKAKFDSLRFNSYSMYNFLLNSNFTPNRSDLLLSIRDQYDSAKYQLAAALSYQDSAYKLVLDEDKFIVNYASWLLPADNYLIFQEGRFHAHATELKNRNQRLWLETTDNQFTVNYENLLIENFTNILEYDSMLNSFSGKINGYAQITDPFGNIKMDGKVDIDRLSFEDDLIGNIKSAVNYKDQTLKIDAVLDNEANNIRFSSTTSAYNGASQGSLILESDISDASAFQPLVASHIDGLSGGLYGRISISDDAHNSTINGRLECRQFELSIIPTNTSLTSNGGFTIIDNVLAFDSFTVSDSLQNQLRVDGQVNFSNPSNPGFDLALKADHFLLINSHGISNREIAGKLLMGIDIAIKGKKTNLGVTSTFDIKNGTDLMYVMPGRELELITDEGIVQFVDFENEDLELQVEEEARFIGDSIVSLIAGIDLNTTISFDPGARYTLVIDPNSGDRTAFRMQGRLNYRYNESEQGKLNGLIELVEGYYDLSFYGLVKKRFDYDPGSMVSWSGDVMDGVVNFSARHTVRTNSVGLVSNEISSNERPLYNQRIPYDVILEVTDRISTPYVNFRIDLPARYRTIYPTLDSKLNILNQPNREAERNKQVFALLVGGTFIPDNPDISEGSNSPNFATTAARNTVNAIMTQQLNKLTGQIIQGLDVDMGFNTFEDYGKDQVQTRTQLDVKVSKNLFNDRVSAEVESHINLDGSVQQISQNTAGMTEFAVSYKLTEQGNYRIKAFRENEFNVFDGEIQNSGIAFIFVREFDSFKNRRKIPVIEIPDTEQDSISIMNE